MSKSMGNVVDPLSVIEKFGTDSLRLSYLVGITPGNDSRLSEKKIEGNRNLVNKLWNIFRYILTSVDREKAGAISKRKLTLADKWIMSRYAATHEQVSKAMDVWNFSAAGETLREFMWSDLADWYLEIAKFEKNKDSILAFILQGLLTMWHPFAPFVTEHIWQLWGEKELLMIAAWPEKTAKYTDHKTEKKFETLRDVTKSIRDLRARYKVDPKKKLNAFYKNSKLSTEQLALVSHLSSVNLQKKSFAGKYTPLNLTKIELRFPNEEIMDVAREQKQLRLNIDELEGAAINLEKRLKNKNFLQKAPAEIVRKEKEKLQEWQLKLAKIRQELEDLSGK